MLDSQKMCDELDRDTHKIEINYITKDNNWILTPVYFPFEWSVSHTLIQFMHNTDLTELEIV